MAPDDGSASSVTGWHTSDPTHVIEVWNDYGFPAQHGVQSIELNANYPSEVYQDVATVPGVTYRYSFWHRGREGTDTADVLIGSPAAPDGPAAPSGGSETSTTGGTGFSDGTAGWVYHTGSYTVPDNQLTTRFGVNSVSWAGGDGSIGNLVDFATLAPADCPMVATTTAGVAVTGDLLAPDQQLAGLTARGAEVIPDGFTIHLDGTWSYTPAPGFSGVAQTTFSVVRPQPLAASNTSHTLWVSVNPVATDQKLTTAINAAAQGPSVLDSALGTNLVPSLATQPKHGSVVMNPDGTYAYTPSAGYSGSDVFTYLVTDGTGLSSAPATVGVTVTGAPNLTVTVTPPAGVVYSGQSAVYTISYSNIGAAANLTPLDATGVVLQVTAPPFMAYTANGSDPGWTCSAAAAATSCASPVGTVAGGAAGDVHLALTLLPKVPAGTHTAVVSAGAADDGLHGASTGGTGTGPTGAANAPNLVVWQSGPDSVVGGELVTYNIDFSNLADPLNNPSPSDATGVVITDVVPPLTTFSAADSAPGWSCPDGSPAGTVCTLPIGSVPAGTTDPQPFTVRVADVGPGSGGTQNHVAIADDGSHGTATGTTVSTTSVAVAPAPAAPASFNTPPSPSPTPSPTASPAPGAVSGATDTPPPQSPPQTHRYDYGVPGGAAIVQQGGPSAFDVVNADPSHSRSALDVALVRPEYLATDVTSLESDLLISILILLLMGISAELVNRTWISHHQVMRGFLHRVFKPTQRIVHEEFGLVRGALGVISLVLFAAAAALIEALLDPHAGFDRATFALWIGLGVAFLAVTACWEVPEMVWLRRRTPQLRTLRILPEALPIAGLCVLLSRVTGLHPGYMFGVLAALAVIRGEASRAQVGKATAMCALTVIGLAAVAYLLTGVVADAVQATPGGPTEAAFPLLVLDAALPSIVMASLGCLVFALLPLHMLRGAHVFEWSRAGWAALYLFGVFALMMLVVHPSGGLSEHTRPLVYSLIPYVLVFVLSLGFYLAFRLGFRSSRGGSTPAAEGAG